MSEGFFKIDLSLGRGSETSLQSFGKKCEFMEHSRLS